MNLSETQLRSTGHKVSVDMFKNISLMALWKQIKKPKTLEIRWAEEQNPIEKTILEIRTWAKRTISRAKVSNEEETQTQISRRELNREAPTQG